MRANYKMQRLFIDADLAAGKTIEPSPQQSHYLANVLRLGDGAELLVFNGRDGEWLARVADVKKRGCTFECERQTRPQQGTPDLWVCFAPIKKMPADYLAQKATELGVSVLQPALTRRSVVTRVNTARMRANAIEAAEQSDRLTVPEVRAPLPLDRLLAAWPADRRLLFCDEAGEAPPIAKALPAVSGAWAVLTGPEGGFDPAERAAIRALQCVVPVSLGPRILRADTAALAALAVWQALAGDWR